MSSTDLGVLERTASLPLKSRPHYKLPGPDPAQLAAEEAAAAQPGEPLRCGGHLRPLQGASGSSASDVLSLRVLLDGSCLEVFTSTGEALATRVYRGDEPPMQTPHDSTPQAGSQEALVGFATVADAAVEAAAAAGAVGWEQLFSGGDAGSNGTAAAAAAAPALVGGHLELVCFGPGPATLHSCSAWQMASMWRQQQQQEVDVVVAPHVTAAAAEVLQGLVAAEVAAVAAAAAVVLPVGKLTVDVGAAAAVANGDLAGGVAELLPLSPAASPVPVQVEAA